MMNVDGNHTVRLVRGVYVFVFESFAEHIVEIAAIQMIGGRECLCFRVEDDAALLPVVLHLYLHTGVAGGGGNEQYFERRSLRLFGTGFSLFLVLLAFCLPVTMCRLISFLLLFAGGEDTCMYLFQQIPSDLYDTFSATGR